MNKQGGPIKSCSFPEGRGGVGRGATLYFYI